VNEWASKDKERLFFDEHQWATVEAAMARIIPADHQPGAKEAGTVKFVDQYLSGIDYIYAKPDGSGFEKPVGSRARAWQRRIDSLRKTYIEGIEDMDRRSRNRFGEDFRQLSAEQQDRVLTDMERSAGRSEEPLEENSATAALEPLGETEPSGPALQQSMTELELEFFYLLILHTRQGFYADPIYGGNKDHAGWDVIGFPGPESLAEVHSGHYTTLLYFADSGADSDREDSRGT
jgi:gluconate 2-dehydrogenase gamma chain